MTSANALVLGDARWRIARPICGISSFFYARTRRFAAVLLSEFCPRPPTRKACATKWYNASRWAHFNIMRQFLSRLHSFKPPSWLILITAFLYLVAAYFWKNRFVFGEARGIYWILIVLDWSVLPLTILSILGFIVSFVGWIVQRIRHQPGLQAQALRSGVLFITCLMFGAASFPLLISPSIPLDSISIRGRTYHLSLISALIDINYSLYECDSLGIICKQIYRSSDYSLANPSHANLI